MNEKIVTVLLGLGLGIILAGVILFGPKLLSGLPQSKSNAPQTLPVAPFTPRSPDGHRDEVGLTISLDTPTDNFWATESPITISGKTAPNTSVALTSPADDITIISDASGLFSAKLKIEEGENTILAIVRNPNGNFITAKKSATLEIKPE